MQSQVEATEFQTKSTCHIFEATVVAGRMPPRAMNDAPHVIALAEPSSLMRKSSWSKLAGVPVRFVVIDVIAVASAVIVTASQVFVLIVGVALLVIVVTRGVMRLLERVEVPASTSGLM